MAAVGTEALLAQPLNCTVVVKDVPTRQFCDFVVLFKAVKTNGALRQRI